MTVIDISVWIEPDMVRYEGDPVVTVTPYRARAQGDPADVSLLSLGSHTGTHVDAPAHFLDAGATVDRLPWDALVGPALVVEIAGEGPIGRETLERHGLGGHRRVLLKTRNSGLWALGRFSRDYMAIDVEAAGYLVAQGIRLVGIDYLSIEPWHSPGFPVHRRLLEAGVVILEGLNLSAVEPGLFELVCLPLPVRGIDGAPCRAILRKR